MHEEEIEGSVSQFSIAGTLDYFLFLLLLLRFSLWQFQHINDTNRIN